MSGRWRFGWMLLVVLAVACERSAPEVWTPARVVTEFVTRLQRVHGSEEAGKGVYELLWSGARQNLDERAERATAVAGRPVAPWEMIAPSRLALWGTPVGYRVREEGSWAMVTIQRAASEEEHTVRCVREDGEWRIVIELPPLPEIERRPTEP